MDSNPSSTSNISTTEANADVKLSEIDDNSDATVSASATSESTESQDVSKNFIWSDVFTEDILPNILDNLKILTAQDLLNFRLVNRWWREAATTVLLKRNLCEIGLHFGQVFNDDDGRLVAGLGPLTFKPTPSKHHPLAYFSVNNPRSFLSDLSHLISASPKFPSTSIRFHSACCRWGFEFESDYEHTKDLLHFFSLHGRKMKKLSLSSGISFEAVQSLLYVHMPHLTCLNIDKFYYFNEDHDPDHDSDDDDDDEPREGCPSVILESPLEVQELIVGYHLEDGREPHSCKLNLVEFLVNVCPHLTAVHNVDVHTLDIFLESRKSHLIKSLLITLNPFDQISTIQEFASILIDAQAQANMAIPQLNKLVVEFNNVFEWECFPHEDAQEVGRLLNVILSGSKNSLKYLEIHMNAAKSLRVNLFIPPLPNLEYLKLVDSEENFNSQFHFHGDVIGNAIENGRVTGDQSVNDFEATYARNFQNQENDAKIQLNYFPRLCQVSLREGKKSENNSDKLLNFFTMAHIAVDGLTAIPSDSLLAVTKLELSSRYSPQYDSRMSQLFPNVSHLTISCKNSGELLNWAWTAFPKLKRFEICAASHFVHGLDQRWDSSVVDSFFTGISTDLCAELDRGASETETVSVVERTHPYIGDCKHLKEFKITFWLKLESKFISKVAATYGFKDVAHRTKIIFFFEGLSFNKNNIQEIRQYLDPYVEIRIK